MASLGNFEEHSGSGMGSYVTMDGRSGARRAAGCSFAPLALLKYGGKSAPSYATDRLIAFWIVLQKSAMTHIRHFRTSLLLSFLPIAIFRSNRGAGYRPANCPGFGTSVASESLHTTILHTSPPAPPLRSSKNLQAWWRGAVVGGRSQPECMFFGGETRSWASQGQRQCPHSQKVGVR